jgi:hypothetical protein
MSTVKTLMRVTSGSLACCLECAKQGEAYTSSGICHDGKSPAFCALQDRKSTESFAHSIALCSPCFAQTQGIRPWTPVERMRSTHGRIHGDPDNK